MSILLPPKASVARDQILSLIQKGKFRPGQCLPSERELAAQFGMDQRTVRRGLADLTQAGFIVKKPRIGNFVQDPHAKSAVTQIAIILPQWITHQPRQHPLVGTLWNGVTKVFDQKNTDTQVHLLDYHHKGNLWDDAGRIAVRRGVRGAVIFSHVHLEGDQVQPLLDAGVKLVTVMDSNADLERLGVPNVNINEEAILRQAAYRLKELGHRRVGMAIHFNEGEDYEKVDATIEAIWRECGFHYDSQTLIAPQSMDPVVDPLPIREALSRSSRPTAVIAQDDTLTTGIFQCCYELGLNVPGDLSVIAIHDWVPQSHTISLCAPNTPDVIYRMARKAASILKQTLTGDPPDERAVFVGCDIRWNNSVTEAPPAPAPVGKRKARSRKS